MCLRTRCTGACACACACTPACACTGAPVLASACVFVCCSVRDGYVMRDRSVIADAKQDWRLFASSVVDGVEYIELNRLLETDDIQDRTLGMEDEAFGTRVNFAYSDSQAFDAAHGSATRFQKTINASLLFSGMVKRTERGIWYQKSTKKKKNWLRGQREKKNC